MICYNLPMEKWSKFIAPLLTMLGFVGGGSVLILYVLILLLGLSTNTINLLTISFTVMPVALIVTMVIGAKYYSKINAIIYTIASFWIAIFLHLLLIITILTLIYALTLDKELIIKATWVIFIIEVILFIYGIWVALYPKVITYSIHAPKLKEKWADKKIVLFSDSHLGIVRHRSFMQKIVQMINAQNPDIVLIAGDLIDGPTFPYEKGLAPLGEIKSTFGTFYTAGNHDEYNIEQEKYYTILNKYVTVLNDKKIMVNDTQLIGVMYAEESKQHTKDRLEKTGYDKSQPSIVMLHDPKNRRALVDSEVTLSFSGHTHGGQFFPFTLFVSLFYGKRTKGIQYLNETTHFTSVGVGTAGPIFRLGTRPEIAVVKID